MESDMEGLMLQIEEKFPKLINCFGLLELEKAVEGHRCYMCRHVYNCNQQRKELRSDEFKIGKYREGFGKPRRFR